jgi:hypothetical protein
LCKQDLRALISSAEVEHPAEQFFPAWQTKCRGRRQCYADLHEEIIFQFGDTKF